MESIDITYRGKLHRLHHDEPIKLSSTLRFGDNPVNLYGVAPASAEPLRYGNSIARVNSGGACNASQVSFVPHCHGTHTECIGHILSMEKDVAELTFDPFIAATLIRVPSTRYGDSAENYNASSLESDQLITCEAIDTALQRVPSPYLDALVIASESASSGLPPYFSHEAMARIVSLGIRHLLVDVPSIDRIYDGGKMDNHHMFWGISDPSEEGARRAYCSVTEMVNVPPETQEESYFLAIHLPDLTGDALPSKPVLFPFSCM